ncbi:MAG: crossover junction endodeoxyribonuclease RuvC [Oscillospiraceae bacterium]
MKILGIDPGYAIIGWGVVDYINTKFSVVDYGAITTSSKTSFEYRLLEIANDLEQVLIKFKPEYLSIEKLFFNSNQKTVIDVAQARGVIVMLCAKHGVEIFEYTPLQVKQSVVGYGRAVKNQVMEMTKTILNLKTIPKPDDTADALALAICHGHSFNSLLIGRKNIRIKAGF